MESVVENVTKEGKFVDRTKVCPLLIRVFVGQDGHNVISDYSRGNTPAHELQLYTWMDTSLKELMGLIRSMGELGRSRGSTFDFTVVYADPRSPNFKMRDIGKTVVGEPGLDDNSTLAFKKFQNGDFIDVAITTRKRFKGNRFNRNDNRFGGRNGEKFAFKRITYKGEDGEGEGGLRRGGDEEKGSRRGADGGERGARKDEGERRMKRRGDDGERGMRRRGDDGDRGMRRGGDDGDRGMRRGGDDGDRAMRRGGDDGEGGARRGERDRPY